MTLRTRSIHGDLGDTTRHRIEPCSTKDFDGLYAKQVVRRLSRSGVGPYCCKKLLHDAQRAAGWWECSVWQAGLRNCTEVEFGARLQYLEFCRAKHPIYCAAVDTGPV